MKIGEIIKTIMLENNLSQTQLANMIGVSQKAISNWLNEVDKPNVASLLVIYKYFGITPNEMLEIETELTNMDLQYDEDEQKLIRAYRALSPGKKQALFQMLDLDEPLSTKKKA